MGRLFYFSLRDSLVWAELGKTQVLAHVANFYRPHCKPQTHSSPSSDVLLAVLQYEGIDVQLESTMDRSIKEPVVSEALALASKLLLKPDKKKLKDAPEAPVTAAAATAGKRKGPSKGTGGVLHAGKAPKGRLRSVDGGSRRGGRLEPQKAAPSQESGQSKETGISLYPCPSGVPPPEARDELATTPKGASSPQAAVANPAVRKTSDRVVKRRSFMANLGGRWRGQR